MCKRPLTAFARWREDLQGEMRHDHYSGLRFSFINCFVYFTDLEDDIPVILRFRTGTLLMAGHLSARGEPLNADIRVLVDFPRLLTSVVGPTIPGCTWMHCKSPPLPIRRPRGTNRWNIRRMLVDLLPSNLRKHRHHFSAYEERFNFCESKQ